jgi:hypothetical protein
MMGLSILKGVIDDKKWINFISVEKKMESTYSVVEQKENDTVSILRFNLYSYFDTIMFSDLFDGNHDEYLYLMPLARGLGCKLEYTTPQTELIKKDTALVFNGKYFEISLPNDKFVNAQLTVMDGTVGQVIIPIIKDSLISVNIIISPPIFYADNQKKMRYKYSEKEQSISIKFNFPFDKTWHKYIKIKQPDFIRYRHYKSIEKHVNDLRK